MRDIYGEGKSIFQRFPHAGRHQHDGEAETALPRRRVQGYRHGGKEDTGGTTRRTDRSERQLTMDN